MELRRRNIMKKKHTFLYLILAIFLMTGCTSKPINTITSQTYGETVTSSKVEKSIVLAAQELGWITKKINDNTIEAKLILRGHEVVVTIPYTASNYSINYKDSRRMNYNQGKGTIHNNYNKWVRNLDLKIQQEINK